MTDITRYPDLPLKMYRVTFDMLHRHTKKTQFFTVVFPAVTEEAARDNVHSFCWGINEATNHLYVTDGDRQTITVFEVEHARVFTENINVDS